MPTIADLLTALQARHAEFLNQRWDSLSADDARKFTQLERDIMEVSAALGQPQSQITADLQQALERLQASFCSAPR